MSTCDNDYPYIHVKYSVIVTAGRFSTHLPQILLLLWSPTWSSLRTWPLPWRVPLLPPLRQPSRQLLLLHLHHLLSVYQMY